MRRVEDALDLLDADRRILDVAPHAHRRRLEALDRQLGAGRGLEREIVFEEVVVPVHVRDGQDLQQQRVVAHQVGDRGIRVDHHLVRQAADAVIVKRLELLVRFAVRPMRIVRRHAGIRHVPEHPGVIAKLELLRIAVEAELVDLRANLAYPIRRDRAASHRSVAGGDVPASRSGAHASFTRSLARNALNDGQMSSLRSISTV